MPSPSNQGESWLMRPKRTPCQALPWSQAKTLMLITLPKMMMPTY
ncbi:hypothetical protein [Moraxella lacunata]